MPKIKTIDCHRIVNSRGDWTIETHVTLSDGSVGIQTIPDGASKGEHEARYLPVDKAVEVVSTAIKDLLHNEDPFNQENIDKLMIDMDGTSNKRHLGGNSILSVSLAVSKAAALSKGAKLYEYLGTLYGQRNFKKNARIPSPIFNILNGGKHANNNLSFQEFMVIPSKKFSFRKAYEVGVDIYHLLEKKLEEEGYDIDVGDEGGFAPNGLTIEKAFEIIRSSIKNEFKLGHDVFLGSDIAAGSFYINGKYKLKEENVTLTSKQLGNYHNKLLSKNELIYYEDPFYENDKIGWGSFYQEHEKTLLIVGDDLVVTNTKFLKRAIEDRLCNGVIVKPNQVGTLTEVFEFIKEAYANKLTVIISHRSGDTAEDTFIADLGVAVNADFIKSGAPARGERVAKYNRLLEIYEELDN